MFLKPTAKPTPRFTPSPRVVFPAPPGSRIASRGSSSGSGTSRAAARRITSRVGSDPSTSCPVASAPPGSSAFSSRSSTGSMSSAEASLSICASAAKHVCTAPKPRIAPHGGLFVYTARPSISDVVDRVRANCERARVRDDRCRARRIGASVDQDPHANGDEPAVARRPVLGPDPSRVAVDVADERLLAVVDDLHRPTGTEREHRRVDLHGEVLATAERAADAGEMDPNLLGLEVEARRDLVAIDVEPLRRDVDVHAALAVRDRDPGLGPQEGLILLADVVHALDGDVRLRVRIAAADDHRAHDVRPAGRRDSRARGGPSSAGRDGVDPSQWLAPDR